MRPPEIVPGITLQTVQVVVVTRVLTRYPMLPLDADDLVQDVCMKLVRLSAAGSSRFDASRSSPLTYVQCVAEGVTKDALARLARDARLLAAFEADGRHSYLSSATLGTDCPVSRSGTADIDEFEAVCGALDQAGGVVANAAAELGWTRQRLYRATTRNGIALSSFRAPPVKRRSTRRAAPSPTTAPRPSRKPGRRPSARRSIPPAS